LTGRNSVASSFASSFTSSASSSFRSRLSVASTFSTSTSFSTSTGHSGMSDMAPSIASSASSRSRHRRPEPRSYPSGLDPTRPVPASHTPTSDISSPLEPKQEPGYTPIDESMSIGSPGAFTNGSTHGQTGESYMFCTYCAELKTLKTFKAKSDWKKHEMRMHETGEDWPCIVIGCNRIFDRQKDFVKHHQRYHSGRPLPSLTDIGITLLPRKVFGCGFDKCKEVSIGWDERCDHVAKHMKNGSAFEQWKYSNVIRNLIRQEALHDTWKDLIACLDERLREHRSQISWCPDNTRILRQKLQCCDLRPSREEVLITALSLRSDVSLAASYQAHPLGFVTPSRDSVPNIAREQRMHILIGEPNTTLSQSRLASLNAALLQATHGMPNIDTYDCGSSPFEDPPAVDATGRRISYMDLDPGEFLDITQPDIPSLPHNLEPPHNMEPQPVIEVEQPQNTEYIDPGKPANPLGWCYPNYFDAAPTFEESPYYDRPSFGQMFSKPLHKIGNKLSSKHQSPNSSSRTSSQSGQPQDMGYQSPIHTSHPPQQPPMQAMAMRHPHTPHDQHPNHHQFRNPIHPHDQLHLFTPHG
jgi:hypothetical protein